VCGITGIFTRGRDADDLACLVTRMAGTIEHRGPDDSGIWVDAERGVALGFRRLSIIDLSELGHQPMRSASGRFTIIFNGEVFNHLEMRRELERLGARFRGHSDTEVLLAAFEQWGIEAAVRRFVGMFGIAVWDATTRSLTLVRDRLGIKPLFVYARPGLVTFGSELKTLVAGPSFDRTLDRDALTDFLRYLYVPGPRTIYQHVRKLPPGTTLTISDVETALPEPVPYWSVEEAARHGLADQIVASEDEVVREFHRLLTEAVTMRMQADVPLGALLSGGIDSTTVVALMQRASERKVKTFSVAFAEKEFNEAPHAARLARHLGTDHTEILLTGPDALAVVPKLAEIFDEPHADTSQIPAFLVCEVARRDLTVALTGDGGDEVYGGYNRYAYGRRMLARMGYVPSPARQALAAAIGSIGADSWNNTYHAVSSLLPRSFQQRHPGEKLHKIANLMGSDSVAGMYRSLVSAWQRPEELVIGGRSVDGTLERVLRSSSPSALVDRMMLADQLTYLPDDQLAKVDRVSMAVSLEVRVPLLDHRLVEFAWRVPAAMKIRGGKGKWILRRVLYDLVPMEMVERPKQGLSVPIGEWLRGPLKGWADDLLDPVGLERDGILATAPVQREWNALQRGRDEVALGLWAVLMFQAWKRRWLS
jgi:asparagine synthase (glutamine-hydrolysing)